MASPTLDQSYRAGWNASRRTRTYDIDPAVARFATRHDLTGDDPRVDNFERGWIDYAAGNEYDPTLARWRATS